MRKIKKFDNFISEEFAPAAEPMAPETEVIPGTKRPMVEPQPPAIIPDTTEQDAPAKAMLPKASAEDVANLFISLINKSGDDIKKYVEKK